MSAFSTYARRSFSGTAAAITLAAAMSGTAAAQTSVPAPAAKLPNSCVAFDGDTSRRTQKYDEPLGMIVEQLKSWSGWPALRAQMKAAKIPLDGLCASTQAPAMIIPMTSYHAFALNVIDAETRQPIDPKKFVSLITEEKHRVTGSIVSHVSTLLVNPDTDPLFTPDQDLHTGIILRTALASNVLASGIMVAAEAAAEDKRTADLDSYYKSMPAHVAEINDFHALALLAKAQKRDISEEERNKFRNTIFTIMLKEPVVRARGAHAAFKDMAQFIASKIITDVSEEREPVTPVFTPFTPENIAEKLKRFPGNLAASEMVLSYKAYWAAHPQQDEAVIIQKALDSVPDQVMQQLMKDDEEEVAPTPGLRPGPGPGLRLAPS